MNFETCSICFEPMILFKRTSPCGHEFHNDCITKWIEKQSTCPLCRAEIKYVWPSPIWFDRVFHTLDIVDSKKTFNILYTNELPANYVRAKIAPLLKNRHGVSYTIVIPVIENIDFTLSSCGDFADYILYGEYRWLKCCCANQDFVLSCGKGNSVYITCIAFNKTIKEELTNIQSCAFLMDGNLMYRGCSYRDININFI